MRDGPFQKGDFGPEPQASNARFLDNESGSCDISRHTAILHKTGFSRSCYTRLAARVTQRVGADTTPLRTLPPSGSAAAR
jgi:hypothetical protein